jgi:cytidine deaminase
MEPSKPKSSGERGDEAVTDEDLIEIARGARQFAHSPYSNFRVGAALLSAEGRVYTGCNIENATYSLTMCAERVAIFKAASEGPLRISKIAVIADGEKPVTPCGCCRQMIWEFGGDGTLVVMSNLSGAAQKLSIVDLFPHPFDSSFLA